jgi:hypothetical protein
MLSQESGRLGELCPLSSQPLPSLPGLFAKPQLILVDLSIWAQSWGGGRDEVSGDPPWPAKQVVSSQ